MTFIDRYLPGLPQPEYIVNDADPEAVCTYPPVALFSDTVKALANVATAMRVRMLVSLAIVVKLQSERFLERVAPSPLIPKTDVPSRTVGTFS